MDGENAQVRDTKFMKKIDFIWDNPPCVFPTSLSQALATRSDVDAGPARCVRNVHKKEAQIKIWSGHFDLRYTSQETKEE
eukprot:3455235-Pleurochrysis_carterae.AAC.1